MLKKQEPVTLLSSDSFLTTGNLTPDGRFLVYFSTGGIFVTSFPDLKGKWQIASAGAGYPIWSPTGKALYYITQLAKMMAVSISTDPVFSSGKPRELFDISDMYFTNTDVTSF